VIYGKSIIVLRCRVPGEQCSQVAPNQIGQLLGSTVFPFCRLQPFWVKALKMMSCGWWADGMLATCSV
jgi:hypothetical protein